MENKFVDAWFAARETAQRMGVRLRPMEKEKAMETAHRCLNGHRESDGFQILGDKHHLEYSLEALVIDKRFTALFSDEECNEALSRLLTAGYTF